MSDLIVVHGGTIPFICHIFLIFFGGFMSLSIIFNPNFVKVWVLNRWKQDFWGEH